MGGRYLTSMRQSPSLTLAALTRPSPEERGGGMLHWTHHALLAYADPTDLSGSDWYVVLIVLAVIAGWGADDRAGRRGAAAG